MIASIQLMEMKVDYWGGRGGVGIVHVNLSKNPTKVEKRWLG